MARLRACVLLQLACSLLQCELCQGKGGCFLGTMRVTLWNNTQVKLDDVKIGDEIKSWDDMQQRPAKSTVRDVPRFRRSSADLRQLYLATGRHLVATSDHPLWSRTQKKIVSAHPSGTYEKYGQNAGLLQELEELEDEQQLAVTVSSIGFFRTPAARGAVSSSTMPLSSSPDLQHAETEQRQLRGVGDQGAGNDAEDDEEDDEGDDEEDDEGDDEEADEVLVKTLSLEPHHWFYVQGVRVHNKGGGGGGGGGKLPPWGIGIAIGAAVGVGIFVTFICLGAAPFYALAGLLYLSCRHISKIPSKGYSKCPSCSICKFACCFRTRADPILTLRAEKEAKIMHDEVPYCGGPVTATPILESAKLAPPVMPQVQKNVVIGTIIGDVKAANADGNETAWLHSASTGNLQGNEMPPSTGEIAQ